MNNLNNSSVDAGAGTIIAGASTEGEVRAGRAGSGTLATGVALRLTDGGVVVFSLGGKELLEREDFWEPLSDLIGLAASSLLTTL